MSGSLLALKRKVRVKDGIKKKLTSEGENC